MVTVWADVWAMWESESRYLLRRYFNMFHNMIGVKHSL